MAFINLNPKSVTGLATVTLFSGRDPFTLILDTGSNVSHLDKTAASALENINVERVDENPVAGICGTMGITGKARLLFYHDVFTFDHEFMISDLARLFEAIKAAGGCQCHGIIGTDFLYKYRCHLDFKKNRLHFG